MAVYRYKALNTDGKKIEGIVETQDEFLAMTQVKAMHNIVIELKEEKEKKSILSMEIGKAKIDFKSLSVMCSQFSIILQSGVPIDTCMQLVSRQVKDKHLREMLEKSAIDVGKGNGIAASFEKNCPILPPTFVETVRAGEESGTLEQSFERLERYYDKSYKTKQKVKQAMFYPVFVLVVAIVVLAVVMIFVIPTVAGVFDSLEGELPILTKWMIAGSEFTRKNIIWIVFVLVTIIIGARLYCKSEKGKIQWNEWKLKIPVLGNIAVLNGASQFANTMATLLGAGMSVSQALEITGKILDNYVMGLEVSGMTNRIEEGRPLGECMHQGKHFPDTLVEMCSIGEETGELEKTLDTIGAYYDNESEYATQKAIQILEPAIMVFMAAFAGFIIIAIYLPMFTMYNLM